jgi:hypothetical protein
MRLIDKDNLRKPSKGMFIYQDEFEDDVQHVVFEAYTKDDIEREPTVKAIPIEYIEAFKKEFRAVASVKAVIEWLLEKWEKENGTEESNRNI